MLTLYIHSTEKETFNQLSGESYVNAEKILSNHAIQLTEKVPPEGTDRINAKELVILYTIARKF